MKKSVFRTAAVGIALLLLIASAASCRLGLEDDAQATLAINLSAMGSAPSAPGARSIDSSLDTAITTYEITLTHETTNVITEGSFEKIAGTAYFNNLRPGTYTIAAKGLNSDGVVIGEGETSGVLVNANRTTAATVILFKLDGNGTFMLDVAWTEGLLENPTLTASLTPLAGEAIPVELIKNEDGNEASASLLVPSGSYIMEVGIEEGSYSNGRVAVVHILANGTTAASYTFTSVPGSAGIEIVDPEDDTFTFELSASATTAAIGSTITITADVTDYTAISWYINNNPVSGAETPELVLEDLAANNYTITCVVVKDDTMASESIEISIGDVNEELSNTLYEEARDMLNNMGDSEVINYDAAYGKLVQAITLNPGNANAALSLGFLDLVGIMVDDGVRNFMVNGLGMSTYPETLTEMYANAYTIANYSSLFSTGLQYNGFNGLLDEYTEDFDSWSQTYFLPHIAGFSVEEDEYIFPGYYYAIISNLIDSGMDPDTIANALLDAIGRSLDYTAGNLENIPEGTRALASALPWVDTPISVYYATAETKTIAAFLYQLESLAYILKAISFAVDVQNIVDTTFYNLYSGDVQLPDATNFAEHMFLRNDPDADISIAKAKEAYSNALALYRSAFAEMQARTTADDSDLFMNPGNSYLFDNTNASLGYGAAPSWDTCCEVLTFFDTAFAQIQASLEAPNGDVFAVFPTDVENHRGMSLLGYNDYLPFFTYYNDPANWPTQGDMSFFGLPNAVSLNFGAMFNQDYDLLGMILELDSTGDPTIYRLTDTEDFELASTYVDGEAYYAKLPDLTFGGMYDFRDFDVSAQTLMELMNQGHPFTDQPIYLVDNGDGSVTGYLLTESLAYLIAAAVGSYNIYDYPLAYHALMPEGNTAELNSGLAIGRYHPTYESIFAPVMITITSAGSFWDGLEATINWARLPIPDRYSDLSSLSNDTAAEALEIPMNANSTYEYYSNSALEGIPTLERYWFKFTAQNTFPVSFSADYPFKVYEGSPAATPLEFTAYEVYTISEVVDNEVFYVEVIPDEVDFDYLSVSSLQDEDDLGNHSTATAITLAENEIAQGTAYEGFPDYFVFTPTSSQITLTMFEVTDNDNYAFISGSVNNSWFDTDDGLIQTFSVTPNVPCYIKINFTHNCSYSIRWNNN